MKWLRVLVLVLFFTVTTLFLIHQAMPVIEADLGWHLQFGKEAVTGSFPYVDTHTFSYFGRLWVNHEWAGDIVYWLLYHAFGYGSLVILVALAFVGAMFWLTYFFVRPNNLLQVLVGGAVMALLLFATVPYIYLTRLTFVVAPLFVSLILILEQSEKKYLFPLLIPLMWLWSTLHGSWVMGGVVIGIYIIGNTLPHIFPWLKKLGGTPAWSHTTLVRVIAWGGAAGIATLINPYGFGLWEEVAAYAVNAHYRLHIVEWLPSYAFPIPLLSLALGAAALTVLTIGFRKGQVSLAQLLLCCVLFLFAFLYRRNVMYLALLSAPVLAKTASLVTSALLKETWSVPLLLVLFLSVGIWKITHMYYLYDIWRYDRLLLANSYAPAAIAAFTREVGDAPVRVFNTFHWGGTLEWMLPNAQMYIDGRGTVTWTTQDGNLLQHYQKILYEPNGIVLLNTLPAEYVFLEKQYETYDRARRVDHLIFGKKRIVAAVTNQQEPRLYAALRESEQWNMWYEDAQAVIYKRRR
jgi:hypothetical protein